MHALAPLIKDLAVILGVASLVTLLFQRLRQPVVLGYLIAGIIVGPYTPPYALVSDIPNIQILSELGVIFLMFSLGLDFSFHKLKRVGFSAGVTGFIEVVLMLGMGMATGFIMGWGFNDSLFLGAALAISSTTIIIKALEELKLKNKRFAELIFGILVVEDLLAILLLVGLSTIILTQQMFSFTILIAAVKLILVVGGWFLLGYFLMPSALPRVMKYASEETITVVSVALCLFLVTIAVYFHYSTALGAFIMGSILAETSLVHRIEHLIRPIRNIFAAVFFVSVGMLIDPKVIVTHLPVVLLLTVITIIGKLLTTGLGAFLTGQSVNTSLRVGFSMAQVGEFSFIIIGLGIALKAISPTLYPIIVAVSAITTFTTPYLIRFSGYLNQRLDSTLSEKTKNILGNYANWLYRIRASKENKIVYRHAVLRLLINGIIVAIIFTLDDQFILPHMQQWFAQWPFSKAATWLLGLILASPFIWAMLTAFRGINPIFYLFSCLFILAEITVLSLAFFQSWLVTVILLGLAILFFTLVYKQLNQYYQWFENRLLSNLQTKSPRLNRYEELAPWDTHLVEVQVSPHAELVNKTLEQLHLREQYGINIVAIYRDSTAIFAPRGTEIIFAFDKLIVLGTDDQIDAFRQQAEKDFPIELEEADLLANFALQPILLERDHPAVGQSIRDSKIREQTNGIIVGLERDNQRILNPHSTQILQQGDLVWLVGSNVK